MGWALNLVPIQLEKKRREKEKNILPMRMRKSLSARLTLSCQAKRKGSLKGRAGFHVIHHLIFFWPSLSGDIDWTPQELVNCRNVKEFLGGVSYQRVRGLVEKGHVENGFHIIFPCLPLKKKKINGWWEAMK